MITFADFDLDDVLFEIYSKRAKYKRGYYEISIADISENEMLDLSCAYVHKFQLEGEVFSDANEYFKNHIIPIMMNASSPSIDNDDLYTLSTEIQKCVLYYMQYTNMEEYFYGYMQEYIAIMDEKPYEENYDNEDYDIAI